MEKAKVYFTDLHTSTRLPLVEKMKAVAKAAGIEKIDFKDKFVAIKMHFGEPGNLAFLRPNYAAGMADLVRSLGGKPYLTDCNTLYSGGRSNAVDHLESASRNGFNRLSAGCDVIIADGVKGTDCRELPIEGGTYCKTAKIGTAIVDSDVLIALSHFKGHEQTGFGGALKNMGMAASFDPVALDQACADMVMAAPALPGSKLEKTHPHEHLCGDDKFHILHPDTNWQSGLEHAERIGIGTRQYELITV